RHFFCVGTVRQRVEVRPQAWWRVPGQLEIALFRGHVPVAHFLLVITLRVGAQVALGSAQASFERGRDAILSVAAVLAEVARDARGAGARQAQPEQEQARSVHGARSGQKLHSVGTLGELSLMYDA